MRRFALMCIGGLFFTVFAMIAYFYLEEDWRGARDWAACRHELEVKGETLDLHRLVPPGNPEDDLSKIPIFAPLFQKVTDTNAAINQIDPLLKSDLTDAPKYSGLNAGQPLDLSAWQKFYRASAKAGLTGPANTPEHDILTVLQRFDPQMTDIDAAVGKEGAFWPMDYDLPFNTILAGSTSMLRPAKFLQLRGIAYLENSQTDLAEKDYLVSFHLEQPENRNDFMVDYLVMVGIRAVDDPILWEGLRRHAWSDAQLKEMETALARTDMLEAGARSLRNERGFSFATVRYLHNGHYDEFATMSSDQDTKTKWASFCLYAMLELRPAGWGDQEFVFLSNEMQNQIEAIDLTTGTLIPAVYKNWKDAKTYGDWTKINFAPSLLMLLPMERFGSRVAKAETFRRLARLACHLEEYRIANGQYPDSLQALPDLPAHLNQEVLSTQPFHYARKDDGYLLYSNGWNEKDDGGIRSKDDTDGDWVWPSP